MPKSKNSRTAETPIFLAETTEAPISEKAPSVRITSNRAASSTGLYQGLETVEASNKLIELVARPASEYSLEDLQKWLDATLREA